MGTRIELRTFAVCRENRNPRGLCGIPLPSLLLAGGMCVSNAIARDCMHARSSLACWLYGTLFRGIECAPDSAPCADMSRAGEALDGMVGMPPWLGSLSFAGVLGAMCYFSSTIVLDTINNTLFAGVLLSFGVSYACPSGLSGPRRRTPAPRFNGGFISLKVSRLNQPHVVFARIGADIRRHL